MNVLVPNTTPLSPMESPKYLGWKVEIKADITPAGVHDVVASGWDFYQAYTAVDFGNDTNTPAVTSNQVDEVFNAGEFQDQTPDPNDDIFGLDGPGMILEEGDFNHFKSTCNFKVWARWDGEYVSSDAQWWIRQKADRQGTNYTVHVNSGGNGTTTLEYTY